MKKHIILLFFLSIQFNLLSHNITKVCSPVEICNPVDETNKAHQDEVEKILKNFKPDIQITKQRPEDLELYKKIKDLFFEPDPKGSTNPLANNSRHKICNKVIQNYGAQEVILSTDDDCEISSLYFKRPNAPLNIIYVTGYFDDQTPTKEWSAPFALLFPNLNILTFDWRDFGDSKIKEEKIKAHKFGTNAYPDIQAAIDYIRKDNNKPIVLVGFCAGAAMILKATIEAQKSGKSLANALVLNSLFTKFENQINRAAVSENRWGKRMFFKFATYTGIAKHLLERKLDGNLYELEPIKMIEQINIPCYFEHFTNDPSAIIEEGIQVFEKTKSFKMFLQSDLGKHARIHTAVPYQYRNAFYDFIYRSQLVNKDQIDILKLKDLEHDQKKLNKINTKS